MEPSLQNPVIYMIERTGLSRAEFAAKYGFGQNFLTRLVQGRAASVTARLESALWAEWEHKGLDQDDFDLIYKTLSADTAFQRWVRNRRLTNKVKLPAHIVMDKALSPFGRLVKTIGSVSKTAQTLAVADIAVQRYASGDQKTMPDSIRAALHEMNYEHTEALDSAQKRWLKDRG